MTTPDLQIVILSGPQDTPRATFGLAAALAAAASGIEVAVVLSMHGAYWAAPDASHLQVPQFPAIDELIEELLDAEVPVLACSTCVDNYCPSPRGEDGLRLLRPRLERVGLGLVAIRMSQIRTVIS